MSINSTIANIVNTPTIAGLLSVMMRLMLSLIFIISGFGKLTSYAATESYMQSLGVPGAALPLVILIELGGGLAILAGFQTRLVAFLLAGFCVVTGVLFHNGNDQINQIMLLKNISMSGGFLALVLFGGGRYSFDK